jgi:Rap1a immunity proteins
MKHTRTRYRTALAAVAATAQDASQINTTGNAFFALCTLASPSYQPCTLFVIGAIDGLNLTNAVLQNFGQKEMFCIPSGPGFHSPVTGVQTIDLMLAYMQRHPDQRHKPTMLILIEALKEAFPCR